ncbi:replication initiator protein [Sigmofec virus UA08Rod_4124]|uniref:Replication initiator protein n=1 Tax=Sigmofec virus UA08Rod_4124 TaxID=2929395 RepID=A0A976N1I5_9VIRU|nr:replication initiator protein [Sigmofec virus UA08Rod_4124]
MCVNHVKILRNGTYSFFPCGKCEACRQQLASARSTKICNHVADGYTCYFVTLSYDNAHIPYIRLSDLIDVVGETHFSIPVYRDVKYLKGLSLSLEFEGPDVLREFEFEDMPFRLEDLDKLSGIRTKISKTEYLYDTDKISVCYTPDFQNFIKRLRVFLQRQLKDFRGFSFYYAPEYGPTSQRYHIHTLLWLPSNYTEDEVKCMLCACWPFCDSKRLTDYVEIARDPSHYVASYVNCDSSVSPFLQKYFKLRSSHSLHFGHGKSVLTLPKIVENFERSQCHKYTVLRVTEAGLTETDVYYPKYIINKLFPKFKGFNRCSTDTILSVLQHPREYLSLTHQVDGYTPKFFPLYRSLIRDRYGIPITFTSHESRYTLNLILRAQSAFAELGYNFYDFADFVLRFHKSRSLLMYKESMQTRDPIDNVTQFLNLCDVDSGVVRNESVQSILSRFSVPRSPDSFPHVLSTDMHYRGLYHKNLKQRKLNSL